MFINTVAVARRLVCVRYCFDQALDNIICLLFDCSCNKELMFNHQKIITMALKICCTFVYLPLMCFQLEWFKISWDIAVTFRQIISGYMKTLFLYGIYYSYAVLYALERKMSYWSSVFCNNYNKMWLTTGSSTTQFMSSGRKPEHAHSLSLTWTRYLNVL